MRSIVSHFRELRRRGKLAARVSERTPLHLEASQRGIILLSSLGVGLVPVAPATFASAATTVASFYARNHATSSEWLLFVAAVVALGCWVGTQAQRVWNAEDPRAFILDEVAGQALVFLFFGMNWKIALLGFVLFRLFDVLKIPPANRLERLPGGWGIMADDIVAALYASASLLLLKAVIPSLG